MSGEENGGRRRHPLRWVLVTLAVLAYLNMAPGERGSRAFREDQLEGFEASRGWPFRCWTRADETGAAQVGTEKVAASVLCMRDRFPGSALPHLCVQPWFLTVDVLVALAFLRVVYVSTRPRKSKT